MFLKICDIPLDESRYVYCTDPRFQAELNARRRSFRSTFKSDGSCNSRPRFHGQRNQTRKEITTCPQC